MIAGNEIGIFLLAWNAYHTPLRYQDWWSANSELPEDVNLLLRAASGEVECAEGFCQANNISKKDLQEAATFFVRQAFFVQGASYYRIMGLNSQADQDQIKEHYRLLMRLFHPDRQQTQGAWTDNFAGRVNQAYNILRKPELREEYDSSSRLASFESSSPTPNTFVESSPISFVPVKQAPPRSPRFKYLPYVVMAGVSLLSVLFLINTYFSNDYHMIVTSQSELEKTTPETYAKSNNLYQPSDTIKNHAELSESLRDLADDPEPLKIPASSSAEISDIERIANLQTKKDSNHVVAVSTKEPSSLTESDSPAPMLAAKPQIPTLAKAQPSASSNRQRSAPNSETRKLKRDVPTRSSSVNIRNNKPTSSNVARINSTYKRTVEKESIKAKARQNAKVGSDIQRNLVKPKTQSVIEKKSISNLKNKRTPNFSERELQLLLRRFVNAYERGDLTTLMSLFTEQARAGGKRGKAKIRQEYKKLFDSTYSRRISLSNIVWRQAGNFLRGDGQFKLSTSAKSQQGPTQSSGKVSFEVEPRNGRLFIRGFYHQLGS